MKTQRSQDAKQTSPPGRQKSRFTLRGRRKKDGVIRGKLRIRSIPGAFLVLGIIVVVVGTALAVAGYWPYRISKSRILETANGVSGSESQNSGWSLGAKGLLSTASFVHSERMKLLGPVIMGVGLFILICANTVLYENRDRETQMLLAQMRSVICSVSAAVPSTDLQEIAVANSMSKHYQWVSSLPAAHLNILCLRQLASSDPLLQTEQARKHEGIGEDVYQRAVLKTKALHHHESESPPSLQFSHSNSCNSSQTDFNMQYVSEHRDSEIFHLQDNTFVKLNNCLMSASSMSTLGVEEVETPVAQPRRCHSVSYRTNPSIAWTNVHLDKGLRAPRVKRHTEQPTGTKRETDSQVCINIVEQVNSVEEQTHRSWPRLDLASCRRYLKLENKEDSVDKLLDHLEQQSSQWDRSFGSGPFQ